jgi:conjugative relaxase-like TrwC/TraI family protein
VVIGYDLVCAAPKSVSLLWAFGDDALRADIAAAMDAGVDAAIGYLERHAAVGTLGGPNRTSLGLAIASYTHEVSRADEAHLHVHNIIANATPVPVIDDAGQPVLGPDGVARVEWRALDSEVLHTHVKTAGYLGAAALRHTLASRRGLRWAAVRNGVAELDGFSPALLGAFSTRHGETHEEFIQLVDGGFTPDAATLAAAQRASRAPKRSHADAQVDAVQLGRLTQAGWTPQQLRRLGARLDRRPAPPTDEDVGHLFDQLAGVRGLTERATTFGPRDVVQAVAGWAADRLDPMTIEDLADRFLADPRVVLMGSAARRRRNTPEPVYTTVQLLEVEDNLLALHRQARVDRGALPRASVEPQLIEGGISAANADLERRSGRRGARLSDEQADLVRAILARGDLIRPIIGPAGTGKTEAMRAAVHALTAAGNRVVATANGGRQAEELRERLGVDSRVVSSWLTLLDTAADPAEVWTPGTVVIVDEATQVGTRDAERLFRHATRNRAVLVLIGDPAQLGSVAAGGWFAHLVAANPDTPALRQVHRQAGSEMAVVRAALRTLRSDLPDAARQALERLARDGRVRLFDTRDDLLAAVVDDWHADRRHGPHAPARMMAERLRDAELLNRAARERLREDGTLTGPVLLVADRDYQAGDEVITLTQAGHTLVPAGRPRSAFIRTGTVGTVTAVHIERSQPDRQSITVHFPGRGEVRVGWAYLTHAFPDGRDGGLGHAYALTAHKAEGATMPTARAVVVDDTSKAGCYVMLSRARNDLRAYLIRRHDLAVDLDDEDWLPVLHDPSGPLRRIVEHLQQSRTERLAREHDPAAHAAVPSPPRAHGVGVAACGERGAGRRGGGGEGVMTATGLDGEVAAVEALRRQIAGRLAESAAAGPLSAADRAAAVERLISEALDDHARQALRAGRPPLDPQAESRVSQILRDAFVGLGGLQPLLDDDTIETININGCDDVGPPPRRPSRAGRAGRRLRRGPGRAGPRPGRQRRARTPLRPR